MNISCKVINNGTKSMNEIIEAGEQYEPTVKNQKKQSVSVVKIGNQLIVTDKPCNVAEYLILKINSSSKSQAQIASDVGFNHPNMITMLKKNMTKLPMDKVGKMANSLNVDPIHLYKLCMSEYYSETWEMIQGFLEQPTLTNNELEIVYAIRKSQLIDPKIPSNEEKQRLINLINRWN